MEPDYILISPGPKGLGQTDVNKQVCPWQFVFQRGYTIKRIINIKVLLCIASIIIFAQLFTPCQVSAISISQEQKLGVKFMKMIKSRKILINDPIACNFVTKIGERIVAQLPPHPFNFSFNIVNEDQFNAFSAPGSNIFVNRGLITALDNVDELAGILGHEIGHAIFRHVSKKIDKSKLINIGSVAGIIAGILIGVKGGGASAVQALTIGSAAAGQTAMLAYSREDEREADKFGLYYTQKAGFSPTGLLTSLEKIRADDLYGSDKIPGYLKTHPGSKERIVYMESWLAEYDRGKKINNGIDPFQFNMVKYRLKGLYGNKDISENKLKHLLEKDPNNPALSYGLALVLVRKSRLDQAISLLKQGLLQKPFDPMILLAMGRIYLMQGLPRKAYDVLHGLENIPVTSIPARYYQGDAKLQLGMLDQAEQDFKKVINVSPAIFPKSYFNLARILSENGRQGLSHYYLGLYYHELKEPMNEYFHLKRCLKDLADPGKLKNARKLLKKLAKQRIGA